MSGEGFRKGRTWHRGVSLSRQGLRLWLRSLFFLLFLLAPPLDLLRFDLTTGHGWFLGVPWTLGIDALAAGEATPGQAVLNLLWRGFLPIFGGAALFIFLAWRYGRLYCGWLCPHFSVVELINGMMRRAGGRLTLWDKAPVPERDPDGREVHPDGRWWPPTLITIVLFGFVWAVVLLTYLLPPAEIYANLWHGTLTRNQSLFIGVATLLFALEFLLARHLFCRFGCAVGLFQSLAWMANDRALLVDFDARRARACADCTTACEHACPMRLKPRDIKRRMFTCTQCTACVSACEEVQANNPQGALLHWVVNADRSAKRRRGGASACGSAAPGAQAQRDGAAESGSRGAAGDPDPLTAIPSPGGRGA